MNEMETNEKFTIQSLDEQQLYNDDDKDDGEDPASIASGIKKRE